MGDQAGHEGGGEEAFLVESGDEACDADVESGLQTERLSILQRTR